MSVEALPSPLRGEGKGEGIGQAPTRVFRKSLAATWWTRKGHYFWYVVREFTALPMAIWLLLLLGEIRSAAGGPAAYHPHGSTLFIVFSVIAFLFAMYHSLTFLSLAGVIIHMTVVDRQLPSWPIVWLMFILWAIASYVILYFLITLGR
jgi:fumarate reductase subunit C